MEIMTTMRRHSIRTLTMLIGCALTWTALIGCGSGQGAEDEFFTSGSREADQRADQRIAKSQQLEGKVVEEGEGQKTLYERLGGAAGIDAIVDDFLDRVIADPRVNWERRGVTSGVLLGRESQEWRPTSRNMQRLDRHLTQFLALATGGPAIYEGAEMEPVHEGMSITNAEFDAAVGDLQATLDKRNIADQEQKELLAVIESTRVQIVEER